jgi:glycosyltransferase involved in cell wall biosynthesis
VTAATIVSEATKRISLVTAWCDRPEISRSIEHNLPLLKKCRLAWEWIVVQCGGSPPLSDLVQLDSVPGVRLVTDPLPEFNKARALNAGIASAVHEVIFVMDCDILLIDDFLVQATQLLAQDKVVTVRQVSESEQSAPPQPHQLAELAFITEVTLSDGRRASVETNRHRFADGERAGPGLVLVSRADVIAIGGYHGELQTWGWEDIDLLLRLQLTLGRQIVQLGRVVHLTHDDSLRALDGRTAARSELDNRNRCLLRYAHGQLSGTYEEDRLRVERALGSPSDQRGLER